MIQQKSKSPNITNIPLALDPIQPLMRLPLAPPHLLAPNPAPRRRGTTPQPRRAPARIHVGALLEQIPDALAMVPQRIRHVPPRLLLLLPLLRRLGETGYHLDDALGFPCRQLGAVHVILVRVAAAEEEEGGAELALPSALDGGALLDEGAHGGDAGARGEHDDGGFGVRWEPEGHFGRADEAWDTISRGAVREVRACHATEGAVTTLRWVFKDVVSEARDGVSF